MMKVSGSVYISIDEPNIYIYVHNIHIYIYQRILGKKKHRSLFIKHDVLQTSIQETEITKTSKLRGRQREKERERERVCVCMEGDLILQRGLR